MNHSSLLLLKLIFAFFFLDRYKMIGMRNAIRWLHFSPSVKAASPQSNLAKLRKATGYSFSNCRKALELHSNDVEKVPVF